MTIDFALQRCRPIDSASREKLRVESLKLKVKLKITGNGNEKSGRRLLPTRYDVFRNYHIRLYETA
jgi:hypothetical protein